MYQQRDFDYDVAVSRAKQSHSTTKIVEVSFLQQGLLYFIAPGHGNIYVKYIKDITLPEISLNAIFSQKQTSARSKVP